MMQGRDRNSYYHPKFLRFLPHLCKSMKRPAKSQKETLPTTNEPDFYKISEMYPIPDRPDAETLILMSTMQVGPHARMPILTRGHSSTSCSSVQEQPEAVAIRPNTVDSASSDKSGEHGALHGTDDVTLYSLRPFQISTTGSLKPMGTTASVSATKDDQAMQADTRTTSPTEADPNGNARPMLVAQDNTTPTAVAAPPCFSPVKISSQVLPVGSLNEVTKAVCSTVTPHAVPEATNGAVTEDIVAPALAFLPAPSNAAPDQAPSTVPKPQAMAIMLPCLPEMDPSSMAQFAAGFAWATAHMQSMMKQATMAGGKQEQQQGQPPAPDNGSSK